MHGPIVLGVQHVVHYPDGVLARGEVADEDVPLSVHVAGGRGLSQLVGTGSSVPSAIDWRLGSLPFFALSRLYAMPSLRGMARPSWKSLAP